jgi:hypothetical protein
VEDVDAGNGVEGDGDIQIQVTGFWVVDAEAVEEDERLLEGCAAEGEISLNAGGGAGLQVEGGVLTEEIDDGIGDEGLVARLDEVDGAIAFGEGQGFDVSGDGDALVDEGGFGLRRGRDRSPLRLLGEGGVQRKKTKDEMGQVDFHDWMAGLLDELPQGLKEIGATSEAYLSG